MTRLACLAVVLLCCGCGADRTGRGRHTLVLTLGAPAVSDELQSYTQAVARLSSGTMRVEIARDPRGSAEPESDVITAVHANRLDLGAVGARAWDAAGAPGFAALGAPMLVDSIALEGDVLRGSITAPMLRSLAPLGFAGLGVVPGPLRRPLGVTRPLVRPADYRGLRIAVFSSRVTEAMIRALGATPVDVPSGKPITGLDGVEAPLSSIAGNRYDARGGFLTTNVALSARPSVVFASRQRLALLTPAQRRILVRAAAQSLPAELGRVGTDERASAAIVCRRARMRLVTGDVTAMRRAFAPVYRRLARDPATRTALAAIAALKRRSALPADTVAPCNAPTPPPPTAPTPFDGVYRMVTKIGDAKNDPEPMLENYGVWIYVFTRGRFAITQQYRPACTWGYGTYAVAGDRVEWRFTDGGGIAPDNATDKPGEDFVFRWNRYRDTMTLGPVAGASSPENFYLRPWRRIATAPTRRYFAKRCPPPPDALPAS